MTWIIRIFAFFLPARLKPKAGNIGRWFLAAAISLAIVLLFVKVQNLTVQRDKEKAARVIAEKALQASERARMVERGVLEKVREQDGDRNKFKNEADLHIERGRQDDDGVLPAYTVDVLERVRDRYDARASQNP